MKKYTTKNMKNMKSDEEPEPKQTNHPKYPVYVVSKGRPKTQLTGKVFDKIGVDYYMVVEEDEVDEYRDELSNPNRILVVPQKYHDEYDTFDDLGSTKSKGPGVARNFVWDHSMTMGAKRHWVFDDNIRAFYRLLQNKKYYVADGTIFYVMEMFVDRYTNVGMAGPAYEMFMPAISKRPPFVINTRIYSQILILNDLPFRWRGRYNEDTDLSLRILKDGWCTVQFNAFLGEKLTTQVLRGGNSENFYDHEGTYPKSAMLVKMHPDVARLSFKYNRIHHHVNYLPFKKNRLQLRNDVEISDESNEYGMRLFQREE